MAALFARIFLRSEELDHIDMTIEDILEQINKLNINKLLRLDGIHARVLRELKCEIADLLAIVCNLSLQMASVSQDWWITNITPIFSSDLGSYGSVNLTSITRAEEIDIFGTF